MNKKGFTLVELLAVLFIIILIGSLAFVSINETGEQFKDMSYEKFEEMIETAAKSYIAEDDKLMNSLKRGDTITIEVQNLVDAKYLNSKNLKSPKTYEEIDIKNSTVVVTYSNYKFEYLVSLVDEEGLIINNKLASDGLILNLSGNDHGTTEGQWKDITANNTITFTSTSGWNGNGLVLDGVDDGIYLGDQFKDLFKSDFTMEIIVNFNDSGRAVILGNYNNTGTISIEKGGKNDTTYKKGRLYYNDSQLDQITTNQYYQSGQTMSIVFKFDKDINTFSFGKDGSIRDNITNSALSANPDFIGAWIGRDTRTGDTCLAGTIYSVRIYNRVLSNAEIQQNYLIDKSLYID